jgi:hypothetical protein
MIARIINDKTNAPAVLLLRLVLFSISPLSDLSGGDCEKWIGRKDLTANLVPKGITM